MLRHMRRRFWCWFTTGHDWKRIRSRFADREFGGAGLYSYTCRKCGSWKP